jgi:formylglycine-generating enzyme required for sulfatase activity
MSMHDVFISYAAQDKPVADAVCGNLEGRGIQCWIAPRDILPGTDRGESVINAINSARVFILIFSSHANAANEVKREVERAVHKGLSIIPFRIEDVPMSKSLEYFISVPHWLDALTPPLHQHLMRLADHASALLTGEKFEPQRQIHQNQTVAQVKSIAKWVIPIALILTIFSLVVGYLVYRAVIPQVRFDSFQYTVATLDPSGALKGGTEREGKMFRENLGNGETLEMVEIPNGNFYMGSSPTEVSNIVKELQRIGLPMRQAQQLAQSETPHGQVKVVSFFIARTEITQAQWAQVSKWPKVKIALNPEPSFFRGKNRPVEQVRWDEAVEFCARLSARTGRPYRLPSEGEWEFACRAGTLTPFHFGETISPEVANFDATFPWGHAIRGNRRMQTYDAGNTDSANGFGLLDMHGNVQEWCMDPWHPNYEGSPSGASVWETDGDSNYRVVRGGSYLSAAAFCRCSSRTKKEFDRQFSDTGFRVAIFTDDLKK